MNELRYRVEVNKRDPDRGFFILDCEKTDEKVCRFPIWRKAAIGFQWHWDGNENEPTISPSIQCNRCGRHFTVNNGIAR